MFPISDLVLRRVQAITGILFGAFLAAHLANTWLAGLSAGFYDSAQHVLRTVYQSAYVEATILAALVVHLATAVLRKRAGRPAPLTRRGRWHRNAGIVLAVFVFGHVAAVRGPSWFAGIYPGFAGMSFTMAWLPAYFYPYYLLFGAAGLFHGLNGLAVAAARLGWGFRPGARTTVMLTALGSAALLLALIGFGGLLYDVGDPYDNDFARLVLQLSTGRAP